MKLLERGRKFICKRKAPPHERIFYPQVLQDNNLHRYSDAGRVAFIRSSIESSENDSVAFKESTSESNRNDLVRVVQVALPGLGK